MPLLANLANGNNYLSPIPTNHAGLLSVHHSNLTTAALADKNTLEFNISAAAKLCQLSGAGPMELESLNDEIDSFTQNTSTNEFRKVANEQCSNENLEKNFTTYNPCDIVYNVGVSSQNLMMMPSVMNMIRDQTSITQTLPQYSLLNHQLPGQNASTITPKLSDIDASTSMSTNSSVNIVKETITCKSCILLPPNPNAPVPNTRERPKGE